MSPFSVDRRVAVVTGASSGLGRRFCRTLHAAGAIVVGLARREDRLRELEQELPGFAGIAFDVSGPPAAVVAQVLEQHGRIDVLVNNAGYGDPVPALEENLDDFRRVLEVNLVGAYALAQRVGGAMVSAGSGSIINITSIYGEVTAWPLPNAAYSASKAALAHLTRDLACQWGPAGVRVNAIAPGFFPSEGTGAFLEGDKGELFVARRTPLGRSGREDELDGPLLFLASDASSYVTGQVLVVDGGWTLA
ncbi:MAG: dehydrogenase, short-chain alcohol dehydrogenase like [Frankiales bacterium]|nr:dehydrogenase, short-chain alcohol dehydrogenase like [Frankiales bacterium]